MTALSHVSTTPPRQSMPHAQNVKRGRIQIRTQPNQNAARRKQTRPTCSRPPTVASGMLGITIGWIARS